MTHYHINVCLPADACPLYVEEIVEERLASLRAAAQAAAHCYVPLTPRQFVGLPLDLPERFLSGDETVLDWGPLIAAYNIRHLGSRDLPEPPVRLDERVRPYQRYTDIDAMIVDGRLPDWFFLNGIFAGLPLLPEAALMPLARRVRGWVGYGAAEWRLADSAKALIGAPIGLIDFDGQRQRHTTWARRVADLWAAVTENRPAPQPWSTFLHRHHEEQDGYPIAQARADFRGQSGMVTYDAWTRTKSELEWLRLGLDISYFSLIEQMALGVDTFIAWYRDQALLGDGLVTLDGRFLTAHTNPVNGPAPIAEQVAAARRIRDYLDQLPEHVVLVTVELFIWPPTADHAAGLADTDEDAVTSIGHHHPPTTSSDPTDSASPGTCHD